MPFCTLFVAVVLLNEGRLTILFNVCVAVVVFVAWVRGSREGLVTVEYVLFSMSVIGPC